MPVQGAPAEARMPSLIHLQRRSRAASLCAGSRSSTSASCMPLVCTGSSGSLALAILMRDRMPCNATALANTYGSRERQPTRLKCGKRDRRVCELLQLSTHFELGPDLGPRDIFCETACPTESANRVSRRGGPAQNPLLQGFLRLTTQVLRSKLARFQSPHAGLRNAGGSGGRQRLPNAF